MLSSVHIRISGGVMLVQTGSPFSSENAEEFMSRLQRRRRRRRLLHQLAGAACRFTQIYHSQQEMRFNRKCNNYLVIESPSRYLAIVYSSQSYIFYAYRTAACNHGNKAHMSQQKGPKYPQNCSHTLLTSAWPPHFFKAPVLFI